ncbi:PQQ-dependent sugar dehydrogenase [Gilvimarinus sp. SDUM040013]|uniref:PQQ-dependent sugar dehydrogenase n=1 Tax=Gilvimarinus gilvus TaxID=3058038 RepID=A0ABU4S0N2_9GAMM|nr:PQQ-dependent sugar dehydrogenase [Gilvimarinus sp. SDUM040013]MDO3387845.1 PQQ-dependent sugar dehydrogenase [Gilvimarinus sp. SDUM040013]MDX6848784.1 PQQ-dependent sugar dehydrogenase [Gilvimarinus sp. SDUM040013]
MGLRTLCATALITAVALAPALSAKTIESERAEFKLSTIADDLKNPWGLTFLPDGSMLVTERVGNIRRVSANGEVSEPLSGLPDIVVKGQGGLLDIATDPDYANNGYVYFSYSEPGENDTNSTALARARIDGQTLVDLEVIFSQKPKVKSNAHFGSRIVFKGDGTLFLTLGDRYSRMDDAQTLDNHHGKVIRINTDGSVPADNPFLQTEGALPEIWSYGHRNMQGGTIHPETGEFWSGEHGAQGGDEINIDRAGVNYGWPVITYGENYGGGKIGEGFKKAGMEAPIYYWLPSLATAGLTFYSGDKFPDWQGDLFVASLRAETLSRLDIENGRVLHEERMLSDELGERIRHVTQGPDGYLYLLTDQGDGKIIRLTPSD